MLDKRIAEAKKALQLAVEISKRFYGKKLVVTYSGGKDSDVMLTLAVDVLDPDDFEVINNHTSVDAPPTVKHIRKVFRQLREIGIEATVSYPLDTDGKQLNMTKLIIKNKTPCQRNIRYCCKALKESRISNRICALGVRSAESTNRKGRDLFATRGKDGGESKLELASFFRLTM